MDNKVQIFFPKCGHVCVCSKYFSRMSKLVLQKAPLTNCSIISENNLPNHIREKALQIFGNATGKIHTSILSGINCYYFIRRTNSNTALEAILIDYDSWAQYDSQVYNTVMLEEFCDGFNQS